MKLLAKKINAEGDITATFLQVLENEDVIAKLSRILSGSIDIKMDQVNKRLDKIIWDSKDVIDRIASTERDND